MHGDCVDVLSSSVDCRPGVEPVTTESHVATVNR